MNTIFIKIINREVPADIIYEDDLVISFLDISPIRKGHALVVPKRVFENILDGDEESLGHMMVVAQKVARALMTTLGAKGVNLHMNNGREAGQDVPHAHIHIIPRMKRGETYKVPDHDEYVPGESAALAEKIKTVLV